MRIVDCAYCGRAFQVTSRAKCCSDLCRRAQKRESIARWQRMKRATDLKWQERRNERQRIKRANDPEWRKRRNEGQRIKWANLDTEDRERIRKQRLKRARIRRATDPEWRERKSEQNRISHSDPEYRERVSERGRLRRATDPEYRERKNRAFRKLAIIAAAAEEVKAEGKKEPSCKGYWATRYRDDPEFREWSKKRSREYGRIKQDANPEYRERKRAISSEHYRKRMATVAAVRELKAEAKQRMADAGLIPIKPPPEGD